MNDAEEHLMTVFSAALDCGSAAERDAYLDRACAGDPALRGRVEALLRAHKRVDGFLGRVPGPPETAGLEPSGETGPATDPASGAVIAGRYKLLERVGEGGMGEVWLAEQTEPVRRKVALKLIKPGMDSRQVLARFEAERQALAMMDHPNIAKVLDGGVTDVGRPFFVMELVKGVPITKFCDEHKFTPRERLELFVPVCQAVQHAHQKGVIHRDIKPSNVLVAPYDGKPVPKVIDFGVAKAAGQPLTEKTLFTGLGAVVGTPEYMSPEQAELNNADIDTRSDVYSLGVLLYELLTGSTPLTRQRIKEAALLEVLRLVREEEPPRPSTRLSTTDELPTVAANRGLEPRKLSGLVRGELDWIVMNALEKDRNRRYETANVFAQDIQRYLADEPVLACPPSAGYRFRKFARRHRMGLLVAAAALLVVFLVAGGIGWVLWDRAALAATRRLELAGRLAETDRTASMALARAEQWAGQAEGRLTATSRDEDAVLGVWGQADAALAEATAALRTGAAEEPLRQRVDEVRQRLEQGRRRAEQRRKQALRREKLLHELDAARSQRLTMIDDRFDLPGGAAKYQAAFAAYGLTVNPEDTAELARRIRAEEPAVRNALLVALHDWALCTPQSGLLHLSTSLWALAEAADDDPWRKRYRTATIARDRAKLRELSVEARKLSLHPLALELLAGSLSQAGERDEQLALLRWARGRHPADFVIQMWLGLSLSSPTRDPEGTSPLDREEGHGCYRAAVALRPDSAVAHYTLGLALSEKGWFEDAIAEHCEAIRLQPTNQAHAYNGLGFALAGKGEFDEAIVAYREAVRLNDGDARYHSNLGLALAATGRLDEAIAEHRIAIRLDKDSAKAHVNFGLALHEKKQLDEAIAEFRTATRLDPTLFQAHRNLGVALRARKQLDEAIAESRIAIRLKKNSPEAHYGLGLALHDKKQLVGAIAEYSTAIELDPKHGGAWRKRGDAHCDLGRCDRAVADYSEAIELNPKDAAAWFKRGIMYCDHLGLPEKAVADFSRAIELDPKGAAAWCNRGVAYHNLGELAKAVADHSRAIELDSKHVNAWLNRGIVYIRLGRYAEAVADLSQAIELNPKDAAAWFKRGYAYVKLRQYEKAISDYSQAIDLNPKDAATWFNRGIAYAKLSQYDRAIADYSQAIDLNPKDAEFRFSRGVNHGNLGQYDRAFADFSRAIELDPKRVGAWLNRGAVYCDHLGQPAKAIDDFSKAIELAPEDVAAWFNRGTAYAQLRQYDKAIADYSKAIDLNPKDVGAWYNRGMVYIQLGRYDEAVADSSKLIELEPKHGFAWYNRGLAHHGLNHFPEALADYRKALTLLPASAAIHTTLARLLATCPEPKLRDPAEAVKLARKAVELAPKDSRCWHTLGVAHYRDGNATAAVTALDTSVKLSGGDAVDFFLLAMAHGKLGHRDEARTWYDKALACQGKSKEMLETNKPLAEDIRRFRSEADDALELKKK